MDSLIAELEAAPEGSRKLELGIAIAINWHEKGISLREHRAKYPAGNQTFWHFPNWTRSLDAALTLVPERCRWDIQQDRTAAFASVDGDTTGRMGTPALALCVAALRARQAMKNAT